MSADPMSVGAPPIAREARVPIFIHNLDALFHLQATVNCYSARAIMRHETHQLIQL